MTLRRRRALGAADHPCRLCGTAVPQLIESRNVRRLRDRLRPRWDAKVRLTEVCAECGGRVRLPDAEIPSGR